AFRVVHGLVVVGLAEALIAGELVSQDNRAFLDVLLDSGLHAFQGRDVEGAELAVALQRAEHHGLANAATARPLALALVLVLLLATYERLINFHCAGERAIEGLGAGRMAKAMQHEPSGLLRDLDIASE